MARTAKRTRLCALWIRREPNEQNGPPLPDYPDHAFSLGPDGGLTLFFFIGRLCPTYPSSSRPTKKNFVSLVSHFLGTPCARKPSTSPGTIVLCVMTFPPKPEPRVDEETDDAGIVHHSPCA